MQGSPGSSPTSPWTGLHARCVDRGGGGGVEGYLGDIYAPPANQQVEEPARELLALTVTRSHVPSRFKQQELQHPSQHPQKANTLIHYFYPQYYHSHCCRWPQTAETCGACWS